MGKYICSLDSFHFFQLVANTKLAGARPSLVSFDKTNESASAYKVSEWHCVLKEKIRRTGVGRKHHSLPAADSWCEFHKNLQRGILMYN